MEIIPEHKFILDQILLLGSKQIKRDEDDALTKSVFAFIDRLYLSLFNAKRLIETSSDDTEIFFGLSLCLRTTMADAFICTELTQLARDCSVTMEFTPLITKCLHFLCDGINQAEAYLQRLRNNEENIDETYLDSINNSMKDEVDSLFKKNSIAFVKIKNTQIRSLLDQSAHYKEYHKHFDIYYTLFSKVEHFGLIYYRWANYPMDRKEESIYKAIRLCMIHYFNILVLLNVTGLENEFIVQMVHSFRDFVGLDETIDQ